MSLREQLAQKRAHTTTETFPLGEEGERAAERLEAARHALALLDFAVAKGQTVDKTEALAERDAAEAEYKNHSMTLTFRGLSPDEFEQLNNAYATPDGENAKVDMRGYTGALMAATVVGSDLTEKEWVEELWESGRWSEGEVRRLRHAAQDAYKETPAPGLPKG